MITEKIKLLQNAKTQNVTKTHNSNFDKTQMATKFK